MAIWREPTSLILASQSRARQALLAGAGFSFDSIPAEIDERAIQQTSKLSAPGEIASLLAREKARWVSARRAGHYVIGADQTLALRDQLFNKPRDRAQATEQLRALTGRRHELHSAVAVVHDEQVIFEYVSIAGMTMRPLNETEIAAYVEEAGERVVTSSVGAYQLEGLGVHLFDRIEGDHFTILGLPLLPLLGFLRSRGLLAL
jgi:septum formation protein